MLSQLNWSSCSCLLPIFYNSPFSKQQPKASKNITTQPLALNPQRYSSYSKFAKFFAYLTGLISYHSSLQHLSTLSVPLNILGPLYFFLIPIKLFPPDLYIANLFVIQVSVQMSLHETRGGIQRLSTCIACTRPWVQSQTPKSNFIWEDLLIFQVKGPLPHERSSLSYQSVLFSL
jgi:hypothetical protein